MSLRHLRILGPGLLIGALALSMVGCEDDDDNGNNPPPEPPVLGFVGSAACATCHQGIYDTFIKSGHPYKLNEVVNNTAPSFPWDSQHSGAGGVVSEDGPPAGTTWSDFAYVIGGFGWKARWVKNDGYILTGDQVQLNLANGAWAAYESGVTKPYDYACFKCHTTGADPDSTWKPGVAGTFVYGGVQCEACHGQGSQHAFDPARYELSENRTAEACGTCHYRDSQHRVAAKSGFVQHHEQYDELVHSPHSALTCVTCHDQHASVVYDNVAPGEGVKASAACITCHAGYDTNNTHLVSVACVDCHMSKTGKSARSANAYQGDIASHIWSINPDPVPKDSMFTADGTFLRLDGSGKAATTLDFACYSCHKDGNGVGGTGSTKTLAELATKAATMHGPGKLARR
jgi:hypothetical protein